MRIAAKSLDHIKQAFRHYLNGEFHQFCLDVWLYGEFDFFLDYRLFLRRHYKSEDIQSMTYQHAVDIYMDKEYNKNLLNPNLGEPRWDKYEWALKEKDEPTKGKRISITDIFKD